MNDEIDMHTTLRDVPISAIERRASQRVELVTELNLYSDSNFYVGFTEDISEGGVFVETYAALPVGSKVALELTLPGEFEIRTTGVVRWVRGGGGYDDDSEPPGVGIQFESLTEEDLALIREFVENRSPLFFDTDSD